jgi:ABC-2 type transport system permease protein
MIRPQCVELIFRKDWLEMRRNWQVLFPLVVVPIVFAVMLPLIAVAPTLPLPAQVPSAGLVNMMKAFPSNLRNEIAEMNGQQAIIYMISLYLFAPVFLIIPIMASSVIASDSFAGEKERRTIEALLATPLSDSEMLLGKMLVSFAPATIITAASFLIYSAVVDSLTIGIFNGRLLLPNSTWLLLIFGLAPALAFADIGLTVIISARVKGVKEAQQISALLLVPLVAAVLGQASGAMTLDPSLLAVLTVLLALIDVGIFLASVKAFGRDKILMHLT